MLNEYKTQESVSHKSPEPEAPTPVPGRAGVQEIAASAMAAPATKLPFFDQIQRAFGRHSIANVRARIGGAANDAAHQLGAHGFAYGEDIVLRDNPDLHTVAHEAAHVIQQRGRASFSGLGAAGDEHEQHAERVAQCVERGESAEALLDEYGPGGEVNAPRAVQLYAGERPFGDYGAITKDPQWLATADAYEKRLGRYAYGHGSAAAALDGALARMKAVLMQHFAVADDDDDEKEKLYREAFTKNDPSSAGQIGTAATLNQITAMLDTGNLRERMTAFYNAAYYNNAGKGPTDAPARGFKQIAKDILFGGNTQAATDLGMDAPGMTELAKFNSGWWRWGAKWLTYGLDLTGKKVSYNFADDPFALGNLSLAKELKGTGGIGFSQNGRTERSAPEKAARARSPQDYATDGMPLSARELAYAQASTPAVNADPVNGKLDWVPGHAYWKMPDSSAWVSTIRDKLRMPVIAGISGTTTRMLSAFQWLNTGLNALDFRLALIGWMLPVGDHSLYEILRGAQLAGVFHVDEGDLGDVIRMYMNVGPLSTADLRANAGNAGMFPHEEIYSAKATGGNVDTPNGFLGIDGTNHLAAANLAGAVGPGFNVAHAKAIHAYTTGNHMVMNAILETRNMPRMAAHRFVKSKLMAVVDYEARVAYLTNKLGAGPLSAQEQAELDELNAHPVENIDVLNSQLPTWRGVLGDHTQSDAARATYRASTVGAWIDQNMERIYDELLAHTNMTVEGLKNMPAAPAQIVWRGDWQNMFWGYTIGSRISIDVLRSFSRDRNVAEGFMSDGKFSVKILLRVQTKAGGSGRDIATLSRYPEDEVLMMPGATLVVTNIQQQPGYTLVDCAEQ